ncbi:MAG: hypothetical protein E6J39_04740 [Chloroflexi bacterium]|nr:MAG: hypothetical protein E6J39_04740 [Chloroflexota bacterium]
MKAAIDLDPYPAPLKTLTRDAALRLIGRLKSNAPVLGKHADEWMRALAGDASPEGYFLHPQAFPAVLLPWFLEAAIRRQPSRSFQRDVVYSTVAGYYFVRLTDDLMDGEAVAPPVVPLLIVLHAEFEQTFHRYFPAGHAFWDVLARSSYQAAETASRDAGQRRITREHFLASSARKVAGAKIPIAAVCHRYDRSDLVAPWSAFVDLLGRWHQMLNDMLGWSRDLQRGTATYFLTEAAAHAGSGASIAEWVISEGYAWGMNELGPWMADLQAAARALDSPDLLAYLEGRERDLLGAWEDLRGEMAPLRRLAQSLR